MTESSNTGGEDIVFLDDTDSATQPTNTTEEIKFYNEPFVGGDEAKIKAAVDKETREAIKEPLNQLAKALGTR
jgi:hypothetical protein